MIEITLESAIDGVTAIVEEFGEDFIYQKEPGGMCRYVRIGEPDCIVGKFLASVGVPVQRLADYDCGGGETAYAVLENLEDAGLLVAEEGASRFLTALQGRQDSGLPWGESLRNAKAQVDAS